MPSQHTRSVRFVSCELCLLRMSRTSLVQHAHHIAFTSHQVSTPKRVWGFFTVMGSASCVHTSRTHTLLRKVSYVVPYVHKAKRSKLKAEFSPSRLETRNLNIKQDPKIQTCVSLSLIINSLLTALPFRLRSASRKTSLQRIVQV